MSKSNFWVISPYKSGYPTVLERVWQFDLKNNMISIGWKELGDVSNYDKGQLENVLQQMYRHAPKKRNISLYTNMIWDFFHTIKVDDIVIARKGVKIIAAVGRVTQVAYYDSRQAESLGRYTSDVHRNFIGVNWNDTPRYIKSARQLGRITLYNIPENDIRYKIGDIGIDTMPTVSAKNVQ